MPQFEFDPVKSARNKVKHGIDFVEAQEMFKDSNAIEGPAHSVSEPRFQVLGRIGAKLWSAAITYRSDMVRIISVRRARIQERRRYEKNKKKSRH
jgi:uncharacterized DUF497 family protein